MVKKEKEVDEGNVKKDCKEILVNFHKNKVKEDKV